MAVMQVSLASGDGIEYKLCMRKLSKQRAVDEAVRRLGSISQLARRLGITRQAIQQWTTVPVQHVLAMEEISGVSRYEMRPDVYGTVSRGPSTAAA